MIIKREIGEKGRIVIPVDIRNMLGLRTRSKVIFEVENNEVKLKPDQDTEEFLNEFLSIARTNKKDLKLKDLNKLEDESYDLS